MNTVTHRSILGGKRETGQIEIGGQTLKTAEAGKIGSASQLGGQNRRARFARSEGGAGKEKKKAATMAELKMPEAALGGAEIVCVDIDTLMAVPVNENIRACGYVFEQPPIRRRFHHDALELPQHLNAVPRGRTAPRAREIRARWPGYDAIEPAGGRMKAAHVSAENQIRPAYHGEAPILKTASEQIDSRKQAQNQL